MPDEPARRSGHSTSHRPSRPEQPGVRRKPALGRRGRDPRRGTSPGQVSISIVGAPRRRRPGWPAARREKAIRTVEPPLARNMHSAVGDLAPRRSLAQVRTYPVFGCNRTSLISVPRRPVPPARRQPPSARSSRRPPASTVCRTSGTSKGGPRCGARPVAQNLSDNRRGLPPRTLRRSREREQRARFPLPPCRCDWRPQPADRLVPPAREQKIGRPFRDSRAARALAPGESSAPLPTLHLRPDRGAASQHLVRFDPTTRPAVPRGIQR